MPVTIEKPKEIKSAQQWKNHHEKTWKGWRGALIKTALTFPLIAIYMITFRINWMQWKGLMLEMEAPSMGLEVLSKGLLGAAAVILVVLLYKLNQWNQKLSQKSWMQRDHEVAIMESLGLAVIILLMVVTAGMAIIFKGWWGVAMENQESLKDSLTLLGGQVCMFIYYNWITEKRNKMIDPASPWLECQPIHDEDCWQWMKIQDHLSLEERTVVKNFIDEIAKQSRHMVYAEWKALKCWAQESQQRTLIKKYKEASIQMYGLEIRAIE